jgi:hypothetical protein
VYWAGPVLATASKDDTVHLLGNKDLKILGLSVKFDRRILVYL